MIGAPGPGELVPFGLAAPGPGAGLRPHPDAAAGELFAARPSMKALSLWQPSASLIARGVKTLVTMLSATDYRGPIAIHAAKTLDLGASPDDLCRSALGREWRSAVPLGAVVAIGHLVTVAPAADFRIGLTRAEAAAGVFSDDRWAWALTDVRALRKPIPQAGRQGLFNWDPPEDLYERLGPVLDPIALTHQIGWGFTQARMLA